MPKSIHNKIYVHRNYSHLVIGEEELKPFLEYAKEELENFEWNALRVVKQCGIAIEVAFQLSKDFDIADEPTVDQTVKVSYYGTVNVKYSSNMIWHHKWQWVEPDYKGFDYLKSKARSELWKPFVKSFEMSRIGNKNYWESIKSRWE
jgi:hypothetical protein